jgi:hypothetical protein
MMADEPHAPSAREIGELIAQSEMLRAEATILMERMATIRARIEILRGRADHSGEGRPSSP